MRIIKICDLILLALTSVAGIIYEVYPSIIPDWMFNAMWITGMVALIVFGFIIYKEKKHN